MEQLIEVIEKEGKPVVSANHVYRELGLNTTHWKRWYTKNILENPFAIEGVDFEVFAPMVKTSTEEFDHNTNTVSHLLENKKEVFATMAKTPEGGRPSVDFAITIDFAKKLSMMARTEKGEEVRRYFLQCEKEVKVNRSIEDLRETNRVFESQISQLRDIVTTALEVVGILAKSNASQNEAPKSASQNHEHVENAPSAPPIIYIEPRSLRDKVKNLVNAYATHFKLTHDKVWRMLYSQFANEHGISLAKQNKYKHETLLDVAERLQLMLKMHKTAYYLLHIPTLQQNITFNINPHK